MLPYAIYSLHCDKVQMYCDGLNVNLLLEECHHYLALYVNIMSFAQAGATVFLGGRFHCMGNDVLDFSAGSSSSCA